MNRKIAIPLTILLISVGLRDAFTILQFYSNQTSIIERFCINKDVPEVRCNGKCYLSKQLEENDSEQDEDLPLERIFSHFELKVLSTENSFHRFLINELERKEEYAFKNLFYPSDYSSSIFHPPESLS